MMKIKDILLSNLGLLSSSNIVNKLQYNLDQFGEEI